MLSRVAESIYWMSRYVERAENIARFIDVNAHLSLDMPEDGVQPWRPLVITSGDVDDFDARYKDATQENVVQFLTFDEKNPNALISCVTQARENARSVREILSSETWETVNRLYLMVTHVASRSRVIHDPYAFFAEIKSMCHLFVGVVDTTVTHGEGWHFARMGRLLERADKTSRMIDVKYFILLPTVEDVGAAIDSVQWAAVLRSASGFQMYRQKYHELDPGHIAKFMILDSEFPRSVHYCLIKAEESLHSITGTPIGTFGNAVEQNMGQLGAELDFISVEEIFAQGLHEFIDRLQTKLNMVGDYIYDEFFAHRRPGTRAMGEFKENGKSI